VEIRCFREGDEEAIVSLWNRRVSGCFAAGPLTAEVFAADVAGKRYFEPEGIILAFERRRPVAFAHAGFKSSDLIEPDLRMGTVCMVALEHDRMSAGEGVVAEAVRYLLRKGARQVEAFVGDFPNVPFYNGLYGGEKAAVDEDHPDGLELMRRCHFNVSVGEVIMTCELADDLEPAASLQDLRLSVGPLERPGKERGPSECYGIPEKVRRASLLDSEGVEKAGITFWHLDRYNRASGDRMAVVSQVGAAEDIRGTGAALALQREVHRILRSEGAERMSLGTRSANGRAVSFYRKLGYKPHKAAYMLYLDWRHYGDYH